MTPHALIGMTAMSLALAAGTATAQVRTTPDRDPQRTTTQPQTQNQQNRTAQQGQQQIRLHRADELIGSDLNRPGVNNDEGEKVGSISDFIIDRGSGEIAFAIVSTGGVLGMGQHETAIAYNQLSWSESTEKFQVNMTQEQIEQQSEFLPEDWNNLQNITWMDRMSGWTGWGDEDTQYQEYDRQLSSSRGEMDSIRGRIVSVNRNAGDHNNEHVTMEVRTETGETHEVVLGPSWYVMGQENVPLRNQNVIVHGREHDDKFVAWSFGDRGDEVQLRHQDGRSAWSQGYDGRTPTQSDPQPNRNDRTLQDRTDGDQTQQDRNQTDRNRQDRTQQDRTMTDRERQDQTRQDPTQRDRTMTDDNRWGQQANRGQRGARYILLSDLIGVNAEARGISSGEVEGALIESNSGKIAFLLFDPNENFMGIGDTVSLVPWQISSVNRDLTVNLDTDATEISRAMEAPDDLTTLRNTQSLNAAYQAFGARPAKFEKRSDRMQGRDGMNRDGAIRDRNQNRDGYTNPRDERDQPARPTRNNP